MLAVINADSSEDLLRLGTEGLAAANQIGDLELVHHMQTWRYLAFMERGDVALAEAELDANVRLDARLRQRTYEMAVLLHRIMLTLMRGELAEAERLIRAGDGSAETSRPMPTNSACRPSRCGASRAGLANCALYCPRFLRQTAAASIWGPGLALLHPGGRRPGRRTARIPTDREFRLRQHPTATEDGSCAWSISAKLCSALVMLPASGLMSQ